MFSSSINFKHIINGVCLGRSLNRSLNNLRSSSCCLRFVNSSFYLSTCNELTSDVNESHQIGEHVQKTLDLPKSSQDPLDCDTFGKLNKEFYENNQRNKPFNQRKNSKNHVKSTDFLNNSSRDKDLPSSNNANIFGSLDDSKIYHNELITDKYVKEEYYDDAVNYNEISEETISTRRYITTLRRKIKNGKLREALEEFETLFLIDKKRTASSSAFAVMIAGCASVGYTKKAFNLFKRMRDRGLTPTASTLTSLFSSCGNSPFKEHGLERATSLLEKVKHFGWKLNSTNYNAMIKAFGMCGDIVTAFQLADEMVQNSIAMDQRTFSSLLSACISRKEDGLMYAILVWRKMRTKNIQPNLYSYSLLLEIIKECNIGDLKKASEAIIGSAENMKNSSKDLRNKTFMQAKKVEESKNLVVNEILSTNIPDVLSPVQSPSAVVSIMEMTKPEDRLSLFGGLPGMLSHMIQNKVKPNAKTFTQLLNVIPNSLESENNLLQAIENHGVIPDIDFCNMLIKRRAYRKEDIASEEVFNVIQKYGLAPNIMTYGVLALICRNRYKSNMLLRDMENSGYTLNVEILGTLLRNAAIRKDFGYILMLMKTIKHSEITANPLMLKNFESAIKRIEADEKIKRSQPYISFIKNYKSWLRSMPLDLPQHPWQQYKPKLKKIHENVE